MSSKKIVVVDDEPLIVDMLTTFLTVKGYTVNGVFSGEDGLAMVQVENPDLLILDLMMPDIEGFEVAEKLRAMPAFANLPILVLSARTDAAAKQRAEDAGTNGYLTKPVKFPELLTEVERLLVPSEATPPKSAPPAAPENAPPPTPGTTPGSTTGSKPTGSTTNGPASPGPTSPARESKPPGSNSQT